MSARTSAAGDAYGVVILTRNEEANLPRCLAAIPAGVPVALIDSGSTDSTLDIARRHGCEVLQRDWTGFADQRNHALTVLAGRFDWIVFIDADEVFTTDIWAWIGANLNAGQAADVIYLSQRIHIGGRMLRFAPHYPIYHPRVVRVRPDVFVINQSGHGETVRRELAAIYVDRPYEHHIIEDRVDGWLAKHVRLAVMDVRMGRPNQAGVVTRRARLNALVKLGPLRAPARFMFHYVLIGGWRDGRGGFVYSALYAWYELTKWLISMRTGAPAASSADQSATSP